MNTDLQKERLAYIPKGPRVFNAFLKLVPEEQEELPVDPAVAPYFKHLQNHHLLKFKESSQSLNTPLNIGIVFSGGPASGGHNVAAGVFDALQEIHPDSRLIGFIGGPAGIIDNNWCLLDRKKIDSVRNQGGFDLLGSGRTKIETEEQFLKSKEACQKNNLDGLVIVGGDDSNTNAAFLAEYFLANNCQTTVVGVPKTIDGDLKNNWIETSFGFDSASKTYSEIIGNIGADTASQNKYYFFIKVMGRTASHLLLECALQTHPNLALISEEVTRRKMTLAEVVEEICDLVIKRSEIGKNGGVILIPEGLIEFIPELKGMITELNGKKDLSASSLALFQTLPKSIQSQLTLDLDPHGNIQVSKIETERLLIELVTGALKTREGSTLKFSAQPLFVGYEGRCCFPSNFDCDYCYALGKVAALLIGHKKTGTMAVIKGLAKPAHEWECLGVPLISMMKLALKNGKEKAVVKQTLVDLEGKPFLEFEEKRHTWALTDDYVNPGPIQFFGPSLIKDRVTKTLTLEEE